LLRNLSPGKEVGQAFQPDKAGKPDLQRELEFIALSRGQRSRSGARKCLLARPGHESGVRDSRCRPTALVVWIMRPWRGIIIILKKAQLGEDHCNFKPRRPDHIEEEHRPTRADSSHSGDDFRTTENTQHTEKDNTQDAVRAEEEIPHGTDRVRRLRHGAAACMRRVSAPCHLCWSQVSPTVFSDLSPCSQ